MKIITQEYKPGTYQYKAEKPTAQRWCLISRYEPDVVRNNTIFLEYSSTEKKKLVQMNFH